MPESRACHTYHQFVYNWNQDLSALSSVNPMQARVFVYKTYLSFPYRHISPRWQLKSKISYLSVCFAQIFFTGGGNTHFTSVSIYCHMLCERVSSYNVNKHVHYRHILWMNLHFTRMHGHFSFISFNSHSLFISVSHFILILLCSVCSVLLF